MTSGPERRPIGASRGLSPETGARLAALWREIDSASAPSAGCERCGRCCKFAEAGHVLYAERIEALHALDCAAELDRAQIARGLCPFYRGGECLNREGRPLGCRMFFCAAAGAEERQALHERQLRRVRAIAQEGGIAIDYRPFLAHMDEMLGREPGSP
ncbi:MAG TPA: hypothetical protein DCM87_01630 [Planctomycetes bacterium]|nr:hypothetical protein [Planctomycetota bacterium]